jgi:hypothetical protein
VTLFLWAFKFHMDCYDPFKPSSLCFFLSLLIFYYSKSLLQFQKTFFSSLRCQRFLIDLKCGRKQWQQQKQKASFFF